MSGTDFIQTLDWLPSVAVRCCLASLVVMLTTWFVFWCIRNHSAALRHRVLCLGLTGVVMLPALVVISQTASPTLRMGIRKPLAQPVAFAVDDERLEPQVDILSFPASQLDPSPDVSDDSLVAADSESTFTQPGDTQVAQPPLSDVVSKVEGQQPEFSWSALAWSLPLLIWTLVTAALAIRAFLDRLYLKRVLHRSVEITDGLAQQMLQSIANDHGIGVPRLLCSESLQVPVATGVLRPAIVLPTGYGKWSEDRLHVVLLHEIMHVGRADVLAQSVAELACILFWFNPLVWRAASRMRLERELASDDSVLRSGEDAVDYADHLIAIAEALGLRSRIPATVSAMATHTDLHWRVDRLTQPDIDRSQISRRASTTLWLLAGAVITCLTVATPAIALTPDDPDEQTETKPHAAKTPVATKPPKIETPIQGAAEPAKKDTFVAKGRFIAAFKDRTPVANAKVQLFEVRGIHREFREIGTKMTDAEGRYEFTGLEPPNRLHFQFLDYKAIVSAEGRPTILSGHYSMRDSDEDIPTIFEAGAGSLSGRVTDETGSPIAGATVRRDHFRPAPPGLREFVTKADGTFILGNLPKPRKASAYDDGSIPILVSHPEYVETRFSLKTLKFANLKMKPSCTVDGSVVYGEDKRPLKRALISAIPTDYKAGLRRQSVATDDAGKFHLVLGEGTYELTIETEGNEWVAPMVSLECRAGNPIQLQPIEATQGGWITGQLINTKTGQPQPMTFLHEEEILRDPNAKPEPVTIGVVGDGRSAKSQEPLAVLDAEGRFKIRVCPGKHFPYLKNIRGPRMLWTTDKVDPIIVREGKTSDCPMTFTPEMTRAEKIAVGQKVLDGLPTEIPARVDAIVGEFRKLNHTIDECETWCLLTKELVTIGKPAVPALCKELDKTDNERMLRRLSFALRATGDPNAMPALIRALPKTLLPAMSDYSLIVVDPKLAAFMRRNQIKPAAGGGIYFSFSRPMRELEAAIERITKHKIGGANLANFTRRKDKRALESQRKVYYAKAKAWAQWWDSNSGKFDVSPENRKTNLAAYVPTDFSDYPSGLTLTKNAALDGGSSGVVVTPIGDADHRSNFFLDLDFGHAPAWPKELPSSDTSDETVSAATTWAAKRGLDLICVASTKNDGSVAYTLKGIGMQVWEIKRSDAKKLATFLAKGTLPTGRKLDGDLLLHQNAQGELESAKRSCFLYLTRQQGLGVIEIDDFVTTARDITGMFNAPKGVGFNRGVRFTINKIAR